MKAEGNGSKQECRELFPPQSAYADSSPAGEHFGAVYNSHIKPALKGEVDMSVSEWTEELHRGCTWLRQPLSQ